MLPLLGPQTLATAPVGPQYDVLTCTCRETPCACPLLASPVTALFVLLGVWYLKKVLKPTVTLFARMRNVIIKRVCDPSSRTVWASIAALESF